MEPMLYIAGAITAIAGAAVIVWKIRCWVKNITDGIKCHLRGEMLRTYYRHHETKKIRQYELENFILSYKAYKALGGNSFIDEIYKEVIEWEVIT